jgi:hypothetical protein
MSESWLPGSLNGRKAVVRQSKHRRSSASAGRIWSEPRGDNNEKQYVVRHRKRSVVFEEGKEQEQRSSAESSKANGISDSHSSAGRSHLVFLIRAKRLLRETLRPVRAGIDWHSPRGSEIDKEFVNLAEPGFLFPRTLRLRRSVIRV